LIPPEVSMC
jgi:hypothetical protein